MPGYWWMCLCYFSVPLTILSKTAFYLFSSWIFANFGSIIHLEGFFIIAIGILCACGILYQSIASHLEVVEIDIDHNNVNPKLIRARSTSHFVKVSSYFLIYLFLSLFIYLLIFYKRMRLHAINI